MWRNMMNKYGVRIGPRAKPYNWPPPRSPFIKLDPATKLALGVYSVVILSFIVYAGGRWVVQKFYKLVKTGKPVTPKKKTIRVVKRRSKK